MIRLRVSIDRGLGNRWLAPLLLVLLVVVLLGIAVHEGSEAAFGHGVELCIALAFVLTIALLGDRPNVIRRRTDPVRAGRAPPRGAARGGPVPRPVAIQVPLRL